MLLQTQKNYVAFLPSLITGFIIPVQQTGYERHENEALQTIYYLRLCSHRRVLCEGSPGLGVFILLTERTSTDGNKKTRTFIDEGDPVVTPTTSLYVAPGTHQLCYCHSRTTFHKFISRFHTCVSLTCGDTRDTPTGHQLKGHQLKRQIVPHTPETLSGSVCMSEEVG